MRSRSFNFSAGPAALPESVLEQARDEMLNWHQSGMSIMEMSHRSDEFIAVAQQAEQDLRDLMAIPSNYKVLFLQGGATSQFSMVPMNLLRGKTTADYINTGVWSEKAIKEAKRYCDVNIAASSEETHFTDVPTQNDLQLNKDAAYLHFTPNETIGGVEFDYLPEAGDCPLVADMSSSILSRPIDVSRYGLIYAGAQKNIGPAGLTLVIVRDDLLTEVLPGTPSMFDYRLHAKADSMNNTPPTFAWYLSGLVFKWLKEQGGVEAIAQKNQRKAEKLYQYIDQSEFYANPVAKHCRSWMNVPFTLRESALDKEFLLGADSAGLLNLQGHRSVGGMRASIYNAVPEEAVDALLEYMSAFAQRHG